MESECSISTAQAEVSGSKKRARSQSNSSCGDIRRKRKKNGTAKKEILGLKMENMNLKARVDKLEMENMSLAARVDKLEKGPQRKFNCSVKGCTHPGFSRIDRLRKHERVKHKTEQPKNPVSNGSSCAPSEPDTVDSQSLVHASKKRASEKSSTLLSTALKASSEADDNSNIGFGGSGSFTTDNSLDVLNQGTDFYVTARSSVNMDSYDQSNCPSTLHGPQLSMNNLSAFNVAAMSGSYDQSNCSSTPHGPQLSMNDPNAFNITGYGWQI